MSQRRRKLAKLRRPEGRARVSLRRYLPQSDQLWLGRTTAAGKLPPSSWSACRGRPACSRYLVAPTSEARANGIGQYRKSLFRSSHEVGVLPDGAFENRHSDKYHADTLIRVAPGPTRGDPRQHFQVCKSLFLIHRLRLRSDSRADLMDSVTFLAFDAQGSGSKSNPFAWISASRLTARSPAPPGIARKLRSTLWSRGVCKRRRRPA